MYIDLGKLRKRILRAAYKNKLLALERENFQVPLLVRASDDANIDRAGEQLLINIFGGIVRCDEIAAGIIAAVREVGVSVPVVVRLEGTNVEKGRQILEDSDLAIIAAVDLNDAATKVVAAAAA